MATQLTMYFFPDSDVILDVECPKGFEVRPLQETDIDAYCRFRPIGGFDLWDRNMYQKYMDESNATIMLAIDKRTGAIAAAASAEEKRQELGWVATHPEYRGLGLGTVVSVAAMRKLKEMGARRFFLLTDDFREAALHIYLKLGWHPVYNTPDAEERWAAISRKLGIPFTSVPPQD